MQENENPQFEVVKIFKTEYKVPLAKPEEVEECEQEIYALCHIFLGRIATISDAGLTVVLNKAMKWDVERGLLPSQIPHKIYKHTPWFKEFEDKLWDEINDRLESMGPDFFKMDLGPNP